MTNNKKKKKRVGKKKAKSSPVPANMEVNIPTPPNKVDKDIPRSVPLEIKDDQKRSGSEMSEISLGEGKEEEDQWEFV